ncbi:surfactant-associated protein 2 [Meriones unguiculatus]|uniref:surfactant-associated protein 2 n=1 Tax=Meriones unguiculatus TaxID=10047 RepID=UPI000B4E9E2E|nr:surfactant-associated protein 2 [Meriones unguiculatus]
MGTAGGRLENPVASTGAEDPGEERPFPHPLCHPRGEVAAMASSVHLFLLLVLLSSSCAAGPKVILQGKLTEASQASQDSGFPSVLQKICRLLHLPPGTNVTLHHKGPSHRLSCGA